MQRERISFVTSIGDVQIEVEAVVERQDESDDWTEADITSIQHYDASDEPIPDVDDLDDADHERLIVGACHEAERRYPPLEPDDNTDRAEYEHSLGNPSNW